MITNGLPIFLKATYGITAISISPAKGGFSTKASYHVVGIDGREYFVKVYDRFLPTTRLFVDRIEEYMPVLAWLTTSPALQGRLLTPIPALDGRYKTESEMDVYAVFLFVHGETPGIDGITQEQTKALAQTLARLHDTSVATTFKTSGLEEDLSLAFCHRLTAYLDTSKSKQNRLSSLISPHVHLLLQASHETLHLRDTLRRGYSPLVLCHGDAHGNNVIQGEQLVLADWEDLRWAPAEADLFIYAWHPYGKLLLDTYTAYRQDFFIHKELLRYYVLRRRIEDLWVDIQRLTEESPDEAEVSELYKWIAVSIAEIQNLTC